MSARKSHTIRFDPDYQERLQAWARQGHRGSVPQLVEWIVSQVVDGVEIRVPSVARHPVADFKILADLVIAKSGELQQSKIPEHRLMELMEGAIATEVELLRIAIATGLSEEYLLSINKEARNGNQKTH